MRSYEIKRFTSWDEIPALSIDQRLWTPPVDIAAWAQVAWTLDALHVRLTAREKAVRSLERGPLGRPYLDSCLEFFLSPVPGDARYMNIEMNPAGCALIGLGGAGERIRLLPERDFLEPRTFATEDGWGVMYRVPFEFLHLVFPTFAPAPGYTLRANCYKCGDLTETPHYLAWNPVACDTPNFHRPEDFGEMVLG